MGRAAPVFVRLGIVENRARTEKLAHLSFEVLAENSKHEHT